LEEFGQETAIHPTIPFLLCERFLNFAKSAYCALLSQAPAQQTIDPLNVCFRETCDQVLLVQH